MGLQWFSTSASPLSVDRPPFRIPLKRSMLTTDYNQDTEPCCITGSTKSVWIQQKQRQNVLSLNWRRLAITCYSNVVPAETVKFGNQWWNLIPWPIPTLSALWLLFLGVRDFHSVRRCYLEALQGVLSCSRLWLLFKFDKGDVMPTRNESNFFEPRKSATGNHTNDVKTRSK